MEARDNTDRNSDQWKGRSNVKRVVDLGEYCGDGEVDGSGARPAECVWDDEQRIALVAISWVSE